VEAEAVEAEAIGDDAEAEAEAVKKSTASAIFGKKTNSLFRFFSWKFGIFLTHIRSLSEMKKKVSGFWNECEKDNKILLWMPQKMPTSILTAAAADKTSFPHAESIETLSKKDEVHHPAKCSFFETRLEIHL
jgi:hypothetical protein